MKMLNGSSKQIAYAEDIKNRVMQAISNYPASTSRIETAMQIAGRIIDAQWWITHFRNSSSIFSAGDVLAFCQTMKAMEVYINADSPLAPKHTQ